MDDWNNYQTLNARMAFTITPTSGKSQVGVMTVQMQTTTNMDTHTVLLSNPQITSVTFPSLDPATSAEMGTLVRTFLNPSATMNISLDRLVASVKKTKTPPTTELNNEPPTIFVSMRPAILLLVNGEPAMGKIANSSLQFVINANWPVFLDAASSHYYLFNGKGWMTSATLDGNMDCDGAAAAWDVAGYGELEFHQPEGVYSTSGRKCSDGSGGLLQCDTRGDHRLRRSTAVDGDSWHATIVWGEYREPDLQVRTDGGFLFPDVGTLVYRHPASGPWTFATYTLASRLRPHTVRAVRWGASCRRCRERQKRKMRC